MRFRRFAKYERGLQPIDMAPLIDVVFQLLIFFMLSSSFTFPSAIDVKLPRAVTSDIVQEETIVITITSENVLYLFDRVVTVKELREELGSANRKDRAILIKSDRRASMGRIVDVWDLCRGLGIEQINIATNREQ